MLQENRRYPRIGMIVAITLTINDRIVRASECRNISRGGMYVVVQERVVLNEMGKVVLTKKCGRNFVDFSAEFRIVREDPSNKAIGLQFTHIDRDNLNALGTLLSNQ